MVAAASGLGDGMLVKLSSLTEFPGPRYKRLGPHSGEWFRDDILIPAINNSGNNLIVDLDDTVGYGSSFLEETFGGLIRKGIDPQLVLSICEKLKSNDDESLPVEITGYVRDAIQARSVA